METGCATKVKTKAQRPRDSRFQVEETKLQHSLHGSTLFVYSAID